MNIKALLIQSLILSFLVVIFTTSAAFAQKSCVYVVNPEAEKIVQKIQKWSSQETLLGVPKENQNRVVWSGAPGVPTEVVTLALHGLFNSPKSLVDLQKVFSSHGQNVMMSRLAGHFESDNRGMKYNIKWQTWLEQTDAEFRLARQLGKKVLLVGHSTGALFATWLALRYPQDVAGLVLFSPAFGVHPISQFGAWLSSLTGITPTKKDGQILYGHAGYEVKEAAAYYRRFVETQEKKNPNFLADTLSRIPIWMANTRIDIVIQTWKAKKFFRLVEARNPNQVYRQSTMVPITDPVLHDNITWPVYHHFSQFVESLNQFIDLELNKNSEGSSSQQR